MWGGIEKSIPRITDWHHKAYRVMTNGDREGQIFLSHPHTNNGFSFLLSTKYLILYWKTGKRLPENPEYAEMQHGDVILTLQWRNRLMCRQRAADMLLFIFYLSQGLVQVCEIALSHMGKTTEILIWCARIEQTHQRFQNTQSIDIGDGSDPKFKTPIPTR